MAVHHPYFSPWREERVECGCMWGGTLEEAVDHANECDDDISIISLSGTLSARCPRCWVGVPATVGMPTVSEVLDAARVGNSDACLVLKREVLARVVDPIGVPAERQRAPNAIVGVVGSLPLLNVTARWSESPRDGISLVAPDGRSAFVDVRADSWSVGLTADELHAYDATREGLAGAVASLLVHFASPARRDDTSSTRLSHLTDDLFLRRSSAVPSATQLSAALMDALQRRADLERPLLSEAAKKVARHGATPILFAPQIADLPYMLADIARYPAAAVAVAWVERLTALSSVDGCTAALSRWRSLYSSTGQTYRALNLTIDAIDDATASCELLCALRSVNLRSPITEPRHLLVLEQLFRAGDDPRFLALATSTGVLGTLQAMVNHFDLHDLSTRDQARNFADWVVGATHDVGGFENLLAHAQLNDSHSGERKLLLPPIPLPTEPEIRFLETVQDVFHEAERMEHCVVRFIGAALSGKAFLFHIETAGEHASAMLSARGEILDIAGPKNEQNAAVLWGRVKLSAWAAGFPAQRPAKKGES